MRLIDADRLLSEKMKSKYYRLPNGDITIPIIDIENAPTVCELVRCEGCANCRMEGYWGYWCEFHGIETAGKWFCSEGRKKDG